MTSVYKKMVQEQWLQLKMKFLMGGELTFDEGGRGVGKNLVGGGSLLGEIFPGGGMSKFSASVGDSPQSS